MPLAACLGMSLAANPARIAEELAMTKAAVPVIDISPWRGGDPAARRALAAEVDRTCREIGFMVIAGHGVDPDLIAAVEASAGPSSISRSRKKCTSSGPRPT